MKLEKSRKSRGISGNTSWSYLRARRAQTGQSPLAAQESKTTFLGKVGADYAADNVHSTLGDEDVRVDRVETSDAPTGRMHVFVNGSGENYIVIVPGANGTVDVEYVRGQYDRILDADCLLL